MTTLADQDYNLLGMSLDVRAHFNQFDLDGCGGDYVAVQDGVSGTTITNLMREAKQGDTWSGWGNVPSGRVKVVFASNDRNCRPNQYCSCRPGSTWAYAGAALKEFELRRHQSTNWYFPPLRFPGQYFDAETDLHENWNRFYEPQTGRYLQLEPLYSNSSAVLRGASRGHLPHLYAYAQSNPVRYIDMRGLESGLGGGGEAGGGGGSSDDPSEPAGGGGEMCVAGEPKKKRKPDPNPTDAKPWVEKCDEAGHEGNIKLTHGGCAYLLDVLIPLFEPNGTGVKKESLPCWKRMAANHNCL